MKFLDFINVVQKKEMVFMYITQEIANRIKSEAKSKKITIKDLLSNCELNINAVSDFAKGRQLSCLSLAKIADCLDCSVDYLLGRTDESNRQITNHSTSNDIQNMSKQALELAKVFDNLDLKKQSKILSFVFELEAQSVK